MECHVSRGCDEMLGYYFSRPVPAEKCGALLIQGRIHGLQTDPLLSPEGVKQWTFTMNDRMRPNWYDVISE